MSIKTYCILSCIALLVFSVSLGGTAKRSYAQQLALDRGLGCNYDALGNLHTPPLSLSIRDVDNVVRIETVISIGPFEVLSVTAENPTVEATWECRDALLSLNVASNDALGPQNLTIQLKADESRLRSTLGFGAFTFKSMKLLSADGGLIDGFFAIDGSWFVGSDAVTCIPIRVVYGADETPVSCAQARMIGLEGVDFGRRFSPVATDERGDAFLPYPPSIGFLVKEGSGDAVVLKDDLPLRAVVRIESDSKTSVSFRPADVQAELDLDTIHFDGFKELVLRVPQFSGADGWRNYR